jgi:PRTRC genetic system protein E
MFVELMPIIRKRNVLLTISLVQGTTIRTTFVPQKLADADEEALSTPLAITGTAEELDREIPKQLLEFVNAHLELQSTLTMAKAEMDAAGKAAREEARKKTTKSGVSAAPAPAQKPPEPAPAEPPPSLFSNEPQPLEATKAGVIAS